MTYQCQNCSYKGVFFKGGVCPGCGSSNIKKLTPASTDTPPKVRKPYMLMLACALWLYLLVEIYRNVHG